MRSQLPGHGDAHSMIRFCEPAPRLLFGKRAPSSFVVCARYWGGPAQTGFRHTRCPCNGNSHAIVIVHASQALDPRVAPIEGAIRP